MLSFRLLASILILYCLVLCKDVLAQHGGKGLDLKQATSNQQQEHKAVFPLFGKALAKKGYGFDLPYGVGLHGLYYSQSFSASNLIITDSTEKISITPDTMIQNTSAREYNLSIRPNIWLFPFLNVYAVAGYTEGEIDPGLSIPSFTLSIEDVGSIPIDTSFELKDREVSWSNLWYRYQPEYSF